MRLTVLAAPIAFLCAAVVGAAPLGTGMRMPALALTDQHDVPGSVGPETRCVLFTRDMAATKVLNEALGDDPAPLLAAAHAVVVSDISSMPSLITKLFALPAMRKRAYRILLDREGRMTADFPSDKGKVTVFHLHALTIERVDYVEAAGALSDMLHQAAEVPAQEQGGGKDGR